jgi:GNAT superfamily N-acetyltransferase
MKLVVGSVAELGIDSSLVSAFYKDHWQRKIALCDDKFYAWQFKTAPSAPAIDNCVVAYDTDTNRLAGVMGLNARPFSLRGDWKVGAELTTWIVAPAYQGAGVGPRILEHIQNSYDILIGMGISAMALPIYLRSGFRYLRAIPRFTKVFDLDALKDFSSQTPLAKKLLGTWSRHEPQAEYTVIEGIDAGADRLLERTRSRLNLFSRDLTHLEWRYRDHPAYVYKTFTVSVPSTGGSAFVCLREELSVPGLRIVHMLDCYGDEDAIPSALAFVDRYCTENQFQVIDFFSTCAAINKFFLASGWFSTLDDDCFQMSHLFHPVELRNPPTTSLIYWAKENLVDMCDFGKLYITKQDADFDRPTLA